MGCVVAYECIGKTKDLIRIYLVLNEYGTILIVIVT